MNKNKPPSDGSAEAGMTLEPKWFIDGNLIYTVHEDGTNDVMIHCTTQPRDTWREGRLAQEILVDIEGHASRQAEVDELKSDLKRAHDILAKRDTEIGELKAAVEVLRVRAKGVIELFPDEDTGDVPSEVVELSEALDATKGICESTKQRSQQ